MENINLRSIKRESIKAIFSSIAEADKISRAEISSQTGLSLMTVGKVADALLNLDIVVQSKEIKAVAGRKAGLISVNQSFFSLILDLSSRQFSMLLFDIRFGLIDKVRYSYNDDFYFDENLYVFLKNVSTYLKHHVKMENCMGIGVSLPGVYFPAEDKMLTSHIPELLNLNIRKIISNTFFSENILLESNIHTAAISNTMEISGFRNKNILYWHIDENHVHGAVVIHGEVLQGTFHSAGNFGQLCNDEGITLEELIKHSSSKEETAQILSRFIWNVSKVVDPHSIILECTLYQNTAEFWDILKQTLQQHSFFSASHAPQLMFSDSKICHAYRGLSLKIREKWLEEIVGAQI